MNSPEYLAKVHNALRNRLRRKAICGVMYPKSRRTDPATSAIAAERFEESGKAASHRQLCLDAVSEIPGHTAAEIARYCGLDRYQVARRLPELRDAGLVNNGAIRKCMILRVDSFTWFPVKSEKSLF